MKSRATLFCNSLFVLMLHVTLGTLNANASSIDYTLYREVLEEFVIEAGSSTQVKYADLKKDPKKLKQFNKTLSAVTLSKFKTWSEGDQIAFIINAYNSFTLQLIIENYPVSSIKKIGGLFGNPWKRKFFQFLGEDSHLDRLEHEILRKDYKEPRIHFAVNCASVGCPPLKLLPFEGDKLENQLESAARHFASSSYFNRYDAKTNTLYLSSIFKWYGSDFGDEGSLRKFLADRMNLNQAEKKLVLKSAKIKFLDYDWNLNEAK